MYSKIIDVWAILIMLVATSVTAETPEQKFQKHLNAMGYNAGTADGIIGKNTISAYQKFLKRNNISFDGVIDANDFVILQKFYEKQTALIVNKNEDCGYPTKSGISRSKLIAPHRGENMNYPSAFMQTTFGTNTLFTLAFPHKARSEPEYTEGFVTASCGAKIDYLGTLGVDLNSARDSAEIVLANSTKGLAIVETGGEFPHSNPNKWEHGRVWLAKLENDRISMHVLEDRLAFYHSITVGDVDGDGLQDIIVQYFNSRDQVMKKNGYLLFLKQDAKGNFKRIKSPIKNSTFGSAVLLTNLDNDPELELVQAGYKKPIPPFKGSFKIFDNTKNNFVKKIEFRREGAHNKGGGVSKINAFDFDNDGDNDLLLQVEGKKKGLMLYQNNGNFNFEWKSEFFTDVPEDTASYQWREAEISDVNNDGYQDVVLNGWGGSQWWENNIGSAVFINNKGKSFVRSINNLELNQPDKHAYFFRYKKHQHMNKFTFVSGAGIIKQIAIPADIFNR